MKTIDGKYYLLEDTDLRDAHRVKRNDSKNVWRCRCPLCSATRKEHKKEKCVAVYPDDGWGFCYHCGQWFWTEAYYDKEIAPKRGRKQADGHEKSIDLSLLRDDYPQALIDYFEQDRKLPMALVRKMGIRWIPRTINGQEEIVIAYPTFDGAKCVNVHYRPLHKEKGFSQEAGCDPIPWNVNSVVGHTEMIITEGRNDAMACMQAGYEAVVSLGNGARSRMELFDGFDRYADGSIRVTDGTNHANGHYLMYDKPMDFFANAEPRLRAYVLFPFDEFRGTQIETYSGVYTGSTPVSPLKTDYSYGAAGTGYQTLAAYTGTPKTLYMSPNTGSNQEIVTLSDGSTMTASGENGPFYSNGEATITGLYLRKYLDPDLKLEDIGEGKSDQPFILMRYADVLLAAAEAGVELSIAGASSPVAGDDMLEIATRAINSIRQRAGATLLDSKLSADNDSRDIVRKERRKELAFEHKSKWDIRRWRVIDEENRDGFWGVKKDSDTYSSGVYFRFSGLFTFYSTEASKWFFDESFQQISQKTFSYSPLDYYFEIPGSEVSKSKYIDQQPNR